MKLRTAIAAYATVFCAISLAANLFFRPEHIFVDFYNSLGVSLAIFPLALQQKTTEYVPGSIVIWIFSFAIQCRYVSLFHASVMLGLQVALFLVAWGIRHVRNMRKPN
jgi:hypothetical protein